MVVVPSDSFRALRVLKASRVVLNYGPFLGSYNRLVQSLVYRVPKKGP